MEANLNDEFKKELSACSDDELRDIMIYLIKVMHIRLMAKTHKLVSGFTLSSDVDIDVKIKKSGVKSFNDFINNCSCHIYKPG